MSNIVPFEFEGTAVRVVKIEGDPWFVGKDVAERLGYANASKAMTDHCRGVTKRYPIVDVLGRTQEARILSEPDVFRLIVGSKLPSAERFERWVFEEVLPAIRKTGGYMVAAPEETPEQLAIRALTVLSATVERQKAQLAEAMPKAEAHDRLAGAEGSLCLTDTAKALQVRPKDFIAWMMASGWVYRRPGAGLVGYQRHIDSGDLEHKVTAIRRPDGSERVMEQTRVTPPGLTKLARLVPWRRPSPRDGGAIACVVPDGADPFSALAFRVRARVTEFGEAPTTLARRCGFGADYIRDVITAKPRKKSFSYAGLLRLADALDCDVEYLTLQQDTPRRAETARRQLLPNPKKWQQ